VGSVGVRAGWGNLHAQNGNPFCCGGNEKTIEFSVLLNYKQHEEIAFS
jgi:hypothetical protein